MKQNKIYIRDPFVLAENGVYYLYGTRSETAFSKTADGFDVYTSGDLENWEGPFEVFRRPNDFWAIKHFWAPEVHVFQGKYYMFATFSDGVRQGTATLFAEQPKGPFLPLSVRTLTPESWACLDGTLYVAKNGDPYLIFCHEWKQVQDGEICAVRLNNALDGTIGDPFLLFKASQGKPAVRPFLFRNYVTDGPFCFRTEDGQLHLLWSSFGKRGYVQMVAHSSNDDIDGVWSVDPVPLFDRDGGHGMIFDAYDGRRMLTLHSPNRTKHEHPAFFELTYHNGSFRRI